MINTKMNFATCKLTVIIILQIAINYTALFAIGVFASYFGFCAAVSLIEPNLPFVAKMAAVPAITISAVVTFIVFIVELIIALYNS